MSYLVVVILTLNNIAISISINNSNKANYSHIYSVPQMFYIIYQLEMKHPFIWIKFSRQHYVFTSFNFTPVESLKCVSVFSFFRVLRAFHPFQWCTVNNWQTFWNENLKVYYRKFRNVQGNEKKFMKQVWDRCF